MFVLEVGLGEKIVGSRIRLVFMDQIEDAHNGLLMLLISSELAS